jgi:monoterpene epsilon-lactone hydrolase
MASDEAIKVREMLEGLPVLENLSLDDLRISGEGFATTATEPEDVTYRLVNANGVPAEVVTPAASARDRYVLHMHGGGFVMCSVASHRRFVGHLSKAVGVLGLAPEYRLAPEHPHPAGPEDGVKAYRYLLDRGIAANHIVISGDSAGAGLALTMLQMIRDLGLPHPAAGVLLSPWVDLEVIGETMETRAAVDPLVRQVQLRQSAARYLGGKAANDPSASPLLGDFTGLPPLLVQIGDHETLLDDAVRLTRRAEEAGVEVKLEVWPEMLHIFQCWAGNVPEADEAIGKIAEWLRPRLGLAASGDPAAASSAPAL